MNDSVRPRIGLVGAGRMGANMMRHLHDLGYEVAAIYDVRAESADELAREIGARAVRELAAVTAAAQTIVTVVTDDAAQLAIFAEERDSLLVGAEGKAFVNCATLSPAVQIETARRIAAAGGACLEACMASSITQARDGTLYLMVAGERSTFERLEPLLRDLGGSLRYVGEAGRAAQVKALVNMVMNINTAGLAEGLGLGDALGLDLDMLRDVFSQTGANSRVLETDGADMQNREHDVYFSAAHAAKDSGIAVALARERKLSLPLAEASKRQYDRLIELGLGDSLDKSGVAELTFAGRRGTLETA